MGATPQQRPEIESIWIAQPGDHSNCYSDAGGEFSMIATGRREIGPYLNKDAYGLAKAFMEGEIEVRGDLIAAVRNVMRERQGGIRGYLFPLGAQMMRLGQQVHASREQAKKNIQFHYDRSNEFYAQFLDRRMVYSEAYFEDPSDSLEQAQVQKLDQICRDLVLRPDERLLDVGCGWGGLLCHAAERFGTKAYGCTLSKEQVSFVERRIRREGLEGRVTAELRDYRDLTGEFDKIASIGMCEHVGRRRLGEYFRKMYALLRPGGLFVNRGIVVPRGSRKGADSLFIEKHVFPGGELVHLDEVVREGERAGFGVTGCRDERTHYGLTCRRWVENLQRNREACRALAGDVCYRTWLLYLAGSAANFEDGALGASQVLFVKPRRT